MIPFIEVIDRSLTGPYCLQEEFDLNVFVPKLREVARKYKIKFDPDMSIPWDDDLADRVFQTAVQFYSQVGTYCIDTERIIKFSESEILEGLKTAPFEPTFGEGRDCKRLLPRKPESEIPPWCFLGAAESSCLLRRDFFQSDARVCINSSGGFDNNPYLNEYKW